MTREEWLKVRCTKPRREVEVLHNQGTYLRPETRAYRIMLQRIKQQQSDVKRAEELNRKIQASVAAATKQA